MTLSGADDLDPRAILLKEALVQVMPPMQCRLKRCDQEWRTGYQR